MRINILVFIFLVVNACSAVDSLQTANIENILIDTPHVEGAECEVSDGTGRKWHVWETPGTTAIQGNHPPLTIICTKKGFKKSVLVVDEHKEELLTIDGKRVDLTIFNQFPTKAPRLIPTAIKATAGFVQDPTGNVSTKYPNQITVWMEPKQWESEEQMRAWAFDRDIAENAEYIASEDTKTSEEKRKTIRREKAKTRKDKVNKFVKKTKEALDPRPYIERGYKNTKQLLDPRPTLEWFDKRNLDNPNEIPEDSNAILPEPAAGSSKPKATPPANLNQNNSGSMSLEDYKHKTTQQPIPLDSKYKYDENGNRVR